MQKNSLVCGLCLLSAMPSVLAADIIQPSKKYIVGNSSNYSECAVISIAEVAIRDLEKAQQTTVIPDGWQVISGAGGDEPKVLICR